MTVHRHVTPRCPLNIPWYAPARFAHGFRAWIWPIEGDAGKLVDPEPETPAKKRKTGKPSDSLVNDLIVPENSAP
jgi:hypothetical protein